MKILGNYPKTRLRRVRKSDWMRRLVSENKISVDDLVLPIFIRDGKNIVEPIQNMPGVFRYSLDRLDKILDNCEKIGIPMIALFPYTPKNKKNKFGSEALNEDNLVCRAIKKIKENKRNLGVMCDVALDPYTDHGQDGILKNKYVDNDETINVLKKQALLQAQMGCDVIAPSDMMDGGIKEIRKILDKNNFINISILSYAVKYASSFYGPFRDAVGSRNILKGDKKSYQMDYKNTNEALLEVGLDIKEGADIVMIKPGLPYLDIIKLIKDNFKVPVFSYQVSGEYSMIKHAIERKIINKEIIIESLYSLKRAGSSAIVTYFALEVATDIQKIK